MHPSRNAPRNARRSTRRTTGRVAAVATALALVVAACGGEEVAPFGTAEVTVEAVAQLISTPATVVARTFTATVRDASRVDVLAPGLGSVIAFDVADGDVVSAGQRLGRLRSDAVTTALRQAEAAHQSAVATERSASDALARANAAPAERPQTFVNRIEEVEVLLAESLDDIARLRRDGASDAELRAELLVAQQLRADYDAWVRLNDTLTSARVALTSAGQALTQARGAAADLTLVAPVDGTVRIGVDVVAGGGRTLVAGSDVTAGQPLVTVTASGGFRIDLTVPEADLAPVTVGTSVEVDLEAYPGTTVTGRVVRIVEASTAAAAPLGAVTGGTTAGATSGATFTAEVEVDDAAGLPLRAGLTGTAVLPTIGFTDRFEIRLEVDEIDVVLIDVGQQVIVELDALRGVELTGTVVALAARPERSATGATIYRARVRLDDPAGGPDDLPPLRGGLTGTGDVEVQRLDAPLTVPSTALLRSGGSEVVFVVRDGIAVEVPVRVLAFGELRAAVEGELRVGERIITTGVERAVDGASVEVR
jgi:multidrug efflux pump subunit AcrA (membrane-fusion protein)